MSWAIVAHTKSGNADASGGPFRAPHAGTVNTTGADSYWVAISHYDGSHVFASQLADVAGNTYTLLPSGPTAAGDANVRVDWLYCLAPTTNAAESWTLTSLSTEFAGLCVVAVSGTAASPTITHAESGATSSTPSAGSLGAAGNLVMTAVADYTSTVVSIDSSFAITDQSDYTGGNNIGIALAWPNLSGGVAGAVNPTWTMSGTPTAVCVQAVSVTGTGGGGGGTNWAPMLSNTWNRLVQGG